VTCLLLADAVGIDFLSTVSGPSSTASSGARFRRTPRVLALACNGLHSMCHRVTSRSHRRAREIIRATSWGGMAACTADAARQFWGWGQRNHTGCSHWQPTVRRLNPQIQALTICLRNHIECERLGAANSGCRVLLIVRVPFHVPFKNEDSPAGIVGVEPPQFTLTNAPTARSTNAWMGCCDGIRILASGDLRAHTNAPARDGPQRIISVHRHDLGDAP
jgi:hypothetical protein